MTDTRVTLIDLYVLRRALGSLEILLLRRAPGGRCVGAWEAVHGRIEAGETPVDTARRELAEETGFAADRLYNLSRVESFYSHTHDEIALIPVFVAFVPDGAVRLSEEHDRFAWATLEQARTYGLPAGLLKCIELALKR